MWYTDNGYEADSLKKLASDIANHCASNRRSSPDTIELYWQSSEGAVCNVSSDGLDEFNQAVAQLNEEVLLKLEAKEEEAYRYAQQIRNDYYSGAL